MHIRVDDLRGPEIAALLEDHLASMRAISPPDSVHALDLERLRRPGITFWTAWDDDADPPVLLGCGALREIDATSGEIKSMKTTPAALRRGVGRRLLQTIVDTAQRRGYRRLWLETGSTEPFAPAHRLYEAFGFARCGPFGDYVDDPFSVFMTKAL